MKVFEISFHDGSTQVVRAERSEDIDGWTYFFPQDGDWTLKAPSHVIKCISRGDAPAVVSNAAAA